MYKLLSAKELFVQTSDAFTHRIYKINSPSINLKLVSLMFSTCVDRCVWVNYKITDTGV